MPIDLLRQLCVSLSPLRAHGANVTHFVIFRSFQSLISSAALFRATFITRVISLHSIWSPTVYPVKSTVQSPSVHLYRHIS